MSKEQTRKDEKKKKGDNCKSCRVFCKLFNIHLFCWIRERKIFCLGSFLPRFTKEHHNVSVCIFRCFSDCRSFSISFVSFSLCFCTSGRLRDKTTSRIQNSCQSQSCICWRINGMFVTHYKKFSTNEKTFWTFFFGFLKL